MATLVLTAVGTAIGGPIGGAIGAALGQQVDGRLFGGTGGQGPRLRDLHVQTSSYGNAVPAIFGAMRVAGTVIWATDLVEKKMKSGGGKGRPSTTSYSYSANLAIALSSRPIVRLGRIWADGNLMRGAAGDLKNGGRMRVYYGHGDQDMDPLIAADVGAGKCPAHRDLAYVVFEDLPLADFGNRIPSMTFEIFEREGPVLLGDIFETASAGVIRGQSGEQLTGYALEGRNVREAVSPLMEALPILIRPKGEELELLDWTVAAPAHDILPVAGNDGRRIARPVRILPPASRVPESLAIRHYDPARDYQTGVQQSERGRAVQNRLQIDLPAAIGAGGARRLTALRLLQIQRAQAQMEADIVHDGGLVAGDIVRDDDGGYWRVIEVEYVRGAMHVSASRLVDSRADIGPGGDSGRSVTAPDLLLGHTRIMLVELPATGDRDPGRPVIIMAAAGDSAGWRRAALSLRQGSRLIDIGESAEPATMGIVEVPPGSHSPYLLDDGAGIEISLLHDGMLLPVGNGDPLDSAAPALWLGGEIIRYGRADYLGEGRYLVRQLLRGCFGSEAAIGGHVAGEMVLLLDRDELREIDEVVFAAGQYLEAEAIGPGDDAPIMAGTGISGLATLPFPPVHGRFAMLPDGDVEIMWVRRARVDYGWRDGVEHPLVEDGELYAVSFIREDILQHLAEVTGPQLRIGGADWQAISAGASVRCEIVQVGRHGRSSPLMLNII